MPHRKDGKAWAVGRSGSQKTFLRVRFTFTSPWTEKGEARRAQFGSRAGPPDFRSDFIERIDPAPSSQRRRGCFHLRPTRDNSGLPGGDFYLRFAQERIFHHARNLIGKRRTVSRNVGNVVSTAKCFFAFRTSRCRSSFHSQTHTHAQAQIHDMRRAPFPSQFRRLLL